MDCYILLSLVFFFFILAHAENESPVFNVADYGATADGTTDNSQAFLKAWDAACTFKGESRVLIPNGDFFVNQVTFVGPCKYSISFKINGSLLAPTDLNNVFVDNWISFQYIDRLTVEGTGNLNGRGESIWQYNDCKMNFSHCRHLPPSLIFDFVTNSTIKDITSINSKSVHFSMFACNNVSISNLKLEAPEDSPNTDGIRIGKSNMISISNSVIATGDDCIAIINDSQNIDIHGLLCGPGHGISIGSMGGSGKHEFVTGITVRNSTFTATDNGVRIKTWVHSVYSEATNIVFENLIMKNSRNPIIIDQQYCPNGSQCLKGESSVQIKNITFRNIQGVSSSKEALKLMCSEALPCKDVKLIDIDLVYNGNGGPATSVCRNVVGSSNGRVNPGGCL